MTSPRQGVQIEITGDSRPVELMLAATLDAVSPERTTVWMVTYLVQYLQERALMRFTNEGDDAVGGTWTPLKEYTRQRRMEEGFFGSHPINVRTTRFRNWLVNAHGDVRHEGLEGVLNWPAMPVDQDVMDKYETAMLGRTSPPTVPRPVVGLSAIDLAFALESLSHWITNAVEFRTGATVDAVV